MTAQERIWRMMLLWAYNRARHIGMTATEATEEAFAVSDFIKPGDRFNVGR